MCKASSAVETLESQRYEFDFVILWLVRVVVIHYAAENRSIVRLYCWRWLLVLVGEFVCLEVLVVPLRLVPLKLLVGNI